MLFIPNTNLKKLYNRSSLTKTDNGVCFSMKNRLISRSWRRQRSGGFPGVSFAGRAGTSAAAAGS